MLDDLTIALNKRSRTSSRGLWMRVLQGHRVGAAQDAPRADTDAFSAMTLDQLGAKMKCDRCGKRPERYYPANQSDTPGFVRNYVLVSPLR
jgi:hypothetical protein